MRVPRALPVPAWVALVAAPALGQVAQLLWLIASSRTMTAEAFGTVLGAQALYMALQILVNAGSWLYGVRLAAQQELSDEARARTTRVRLELALAGALGSAAFVAAAGGEMGLAVVPYAVALVLFALMNTWEPFGCGRRAPYLGYIAFRSVTPALVAWALLLAGAAQPVLVPGVAECATIMLGSIIFGLMPLRDLRRALAARSGPRAGILRVSLPQIGGQVVLAMGTLTLSLIGAATSAGRFAAGIKLLGGFTTLVGSAALDSFRGIARGGEGDDRRGDWLVALVTTLSWLSLVLMASLALAGPLLASMLLDDASAASVATIMAVVAAIPPAGFVAALTGPLTARGEEAALGKTYLLGVLIMAGGAGLVVLVEGSSAEMGVALVAANCAMALRLVRQARALLLEARVGVLLGRACGGAAVGLVATFAPSLRLPLLALLLAVSSVGFALAGGALLLARAGGAARAASALAASDRPARRRRLLLPLRLALAPAAALATAGWSPLGAGSAGPVARRRHSHAGAEPQDAIPERPAAASAELKPPRRAAACVRALLTRARSLSHRAVTLERPGELRILFYHRIAPERDPLAVKPDDFERQMELLESEGYTVLDVASAWDRLAAGDAPKRLLALSFDDGYRDFGERVLPVLERHGFGASVFVCPRLIDGTASMSWYRTPPPLLSWDEIAALDGDRVRFEPHSLTHANLRALDDASAAREVGESTRVLERVLGRRAQVFCYPGGLAGRREQELVSQAELKLAVTCEPGAASPRANPLALPRTAVHRHDSLGDFSAKLAGRHDRPLLGQALYQRLRYGPDPNTPLRRPSWSTTLW